MTALTAGKNNISISVRYLTELLRDIGRIIVENMKLNLVILLVSILLLVSRSQEQKKGTRVAIVLTLAGGTKLSEYFEWTCMSIGASAAIADMLVFHESNSEVFKREKDGKCASNVKFIDLGNGGLVSSIVSLVLDSDSTLQLSDTKSSTDQLVTALNTVVANIPRYLVEVKPMLGELLRSHLTRYSHWSYSDPDILFGTTEVLLYLSNYHSKQRK